VKFIVKKGEMNYRILAVNTVVYGAMHRDWAIWPRGPKR